MAILKPGETYDFDKANNELRKKRLERQRFSQPEQPSISFPNMEQRIAEPQPVPVNRPATTTAGRVSTPTPTRTFTPLGQASRLGIEPSEMPEDFSAYKNREYSTSLDRQNRYGGGNLSGQQARIGATLQDEDVYNKAVDELMQKEMAKYSAKWNGQNTVNTPTGQANRLGVDTTKTLPARNRKYADTFLGQTQANLSRSRLSQDEHDAFSRYMNDPTEANKAYAENIKSINQGFTEKNSNLFDAVGPDGKPLGVINQALSQSLAGQIPQFIDQTIAGIGGALAGGAAGSFVPVLGTAAGAKAGYAAGRSLNSYNQMQGAAYSALMDAGIDEQTAMRAASDEALVSSLIELADAGFDLVMLGGGKLINSIAGQGIKQTAKAFAKKGTYEVAESGLKKFAKALSKYGFNIGQEYAEEYAQETVSMANIDRVKSGNQGGGALGLAGDTVSKLFNMSPEEKAQAKAAGMEGLKVAALMGGATAVINYSVANGIDTSKAKSYGKMIKAADLVDGMVSAGLESPKDSVAYDLASKLSEKVNKAIIPSDAEVGKLYVANAKYAATRPVEPSPTNTNDTNDTDMQRPTTQEVPFSNENGEFGKAGEHTINQIYDPNIDRAAYYADYSRIYTAAKNGEDISTVDLGSISEQNAKAIYVAQEADAVSAKQQEFFGKDSGLVRNQTLANARIPSSAKRTLNTLAKTLGVKIELVDSITDADGHEANASISDGVIRVAMNSEQPLFTATVHEAVHRIKSADTESYNQLRGLVFKALQDSDKKQLAKSLKSRGKTYDTLNQETISEELVADAIGYALGDEKTLREVLGDNRNIIQKVYDVISDMITAVRRALGNKSLKLSKEQRAEFAALEKNLSELQRTVKTALANVKEVADKKTTAKPTGTKYSLKVTDRETLSFLNGQLNRGEVVEVYRAMQRVDGKLYPPMAGTVNGKWQNPTELNSWEMSEEIKDFDAAVKSGLLKAYKGKNGETLYKFNLTKGATKEFDGGTTVAADYAPYIHTSLSMLNDQFTSAYKRNNLVVVRGYVPNSELDGAYQAKGAKKSTGETTWHSGVVSSKMPDTRRVILSRYFMPVEVLSDEAVAQGIKSSMKGKDIEIPYNVVSPGLRRALEAEGVSIGEGKGIKNLPPKSTVRYSLKDSEGRQLTEAQAEFFKDSKVRDKDGNLLVVYHGSPNSFTEFDTGLAKNKPSKYQLLFGTHFTTNKEIASKYANEKLSPTVRRGNGATVYEAHLNIKNPLDLVNANTSVVGKYNENSPLVSNEKMFNAIEAVLTPSERKKYKRTTSDGDVYVLDHILDGVTPARAQEIVRGLGYDGIKYNAKYAAGVATQLNRYTADVSYIALDPSQIKSIDNANPTDNPDIRYSLKQMDKDYLAAAEAGDTETAQRMVDEAAKKAGYTIKAYHGTQKEFFVFDENKLSDGMFGRSFHFTTLIDKAYSYGDRVVNAFLKSQNPLTKEALSKELTSDEMTVVGRAVLGDPSYVHNKSGKNPTLASVFDSQKNRAGREIFNALAALGYDSIKIDDVVAVFSPDQIKSADPITRDDEGNIIPLSERFNPDNDDIRYSRKGVDDAFEEVEQLMNRTDYLKSQLAQADKPLTDRKSVMKFANELVKEYGDKYGVEKINADLLDLYDYIAQKGDSKGNELTWDTVYDKAASLAINLVQNAEILNDDMYKQYKDLRDYLRTASIRVTDRVKADIPDYAAFRKRNFGKMRGLSSKGKMPIDTLYQQLASMYPEFFDEEKYQAEADQLNHIVEVLDSLGRTFENPYSYDLAAAAEYLTDEIIERFYDIPQQASENTAKVKIDAKKLIERERDRRNVSVEKLVEKYGAIKRGESPVRDVKVPKQTTPTDRVRQFARTAIEAGATTDELAKILEQEVADGTFSYDPIPDKSAQAYADDVVTNLGIDKGMAIWEGVVTGSSLATKEQIALAERLYVEAAQAGDYDTAVKLAAEIAAEGTRAGQAVQAMRLLKKMSGTGQMYYVDRVVANLQKDLDKRFKGKAPKLDIPDDLRDNLANAKSQDEIDAAVDAILDHVAQQVPSTWFDKWNAWRYLAMLGNPRTHIRNLFGNAIFIPMVTMKNIIATGIEAVVKPEVRTKSLAGSIPGTGGKYRDFAITDYAEVEEFLHMGGKMNPSDIIRDRQRMFSWNTLEWLRKQNFKLLEKEDNFFLKFHYTRAMTQYLSSNNIDVETMDGKTLISARDYAIKEAQKATYRDASAFANTLNKMSKKNTALGIIIEGIMPFKKTPVNILKRGMEYSPLGILDTMTRQAAKLKGGEITVNEFIDRLASGLTGTGVMALGMYFASQELLTASNGKDKEDEYEELLGEQEYSFILGDTRYSIDWMMPFALPLFLGVEIYNATKEEYTATKILDAAALVAEPLFNLSMLNGLNNTIKAAQYEDNPMFGVSREVLFNYFGQAIPTLSGQIARTIDDTRRTTYTDKNSPIPTALQYPLQRNLNKIPIVSENSLPYIDAWGRTEKTGKNVASRAVANMLSPGYVSTYGMSKMEKELKRLAKAADDTGVLPANAPKKFSLNGEDYNLTADQYEKYATKRGKTAHDLLTNLIDKQTLYGYSKLSNTEKAAYVKRVYDYANALAKMQVSKYEPDGWIKQAIEGEKLGIKPLTVIQFYSTSDANGNNYRSKEEKEQAVKAIKNLTKEQRDFLLGE